MLTRRGVVTGAAGVAAGLAAGSARRALAADPITIGFGLKVVYNKTYPPSTADYTPIVRAIQATSPDIVFVASPDTVGMVRAASEVGLKTKMFGGGMVGLQASASRRNSARC